MVNLVDLNQIAISAYKFHHHIGGKNILFALVSVLFENFYGKWQQMPC